MKLSNAIVEGKWKEKKTPSCQITNLKGFAKSEEEASMSTGDSSGGSDNISGSPSGSSVEQFNEP
jgi:hypothetical protein